LSPSKPVLHQSMINDYLNCPKIYYYKNVEMLASRVTEDMYLGSCVHAALAEAARSNLAADLAAEYFEYEFLANEKKEEVEIIHRDNLLTDGSELVKEYVSNFPLDWIAVEQSVEVDLGNIVLAGTIDRINSKGTIIDYKVVGRPRKTERPDVQAVLYSILSGSQSFEYHSLVRASVPYIKIATINIPDSLIKWFKEEFLVNIVGSIGSGYFVPNFVSWCCDKKFCPFYNYCVGSKL